MAKQKPKRHNAPWKSAELARMRSLAARERSSKEAAGELGRTQGAVKYKAMVEGIRFHSIEQPSGPQKTLGRRRKKYGMHVTLRAA